MKRTDYINWDEYFMGIALLTAMPSLERWRMLSLVISRL